jgi:hypothetical protein
LVIDITNIEEFSNSLKALETFSASLEFGRPIYIKKFPGSRRVWLWDAFRDEERLWISLILHVEKYLRSNWEAMAEYNGSD